MTKDDYLRIAREIWGNSLGNTMDEELVNDICNFASTIAALEREECAKVCEYRMAVTDGQAANFERQVNIFCAAAIRNKEGK